MNSMNKIDGMSMNLTAENVARLKAIFPEAVTEGKIDFDMLKSLLSGEIESRQEYYKFTQNGKVATRQYARIRSMGMLRSSTYLDETIPATVADAIVTLKEEYAPIVPMQVVFRDNGFNDVSKTNALQILKQNGFDEKSVQTI